MKIITVILFRQALSGSLPTYHLYLNGDFYSWWFPHNVKRVVAEIIVHGRALWRS